MDHSSESSGGEADCQFFDETKNCIRISLDDIRDLKVNRQRPTFVMRRSELKVPTLETAHVSISTCDNQNLQKDPCAQDQQQ